MLDSLRKFGSSLFGKIMLAFLLVGLAGFGISGVLTSIGSNTVARVGDQEITVRDFQRAFNNQLNATAQQTGSLPTTEQAVAMGIPGSVINTLAANAALDSLSARLGLGASDERLGKMLRNDQSFAGTLGQFDRSSFQRALQNAGFTETEYINNLRKAAGRQQLISASLAEISMPEAALEIINRYTGDRRAVSYYVLRPASIPAPAAPTVAEMTAYLTDNQSFFRTQETRTAHVMVLDVASLATGVDVSEDEIVAEYERTKSGLTTPETRSIRQVVLNADNKGAFEAGKADGKSFDELVATAGLTPTDLGELTKGAITDSNLAETAFSLDLGEFAIIPGALGDRAVQVAAITPAGEKALDEVRGDIEQSLKEKSARNEYADVLDGIEELRAAFRPLDEIAERFKLNVTPVDVTADGAALVDIAAIPENFRTRIATTIFSTQMGDLAPSIALGANLNVWFDLNTIEPARDQTLDEVRDEISTKIVAERTSAALDAAAEEDVAAIKRGLSLDLAASSRGTFTVPSENFSRSGLETSEIDPTVAASAFAGPIGTVDASLNANGNYVVFKVTNIVPPTDQPAASARDFLFTSWRDSVYSALVTALRSDSGLSVSEGTLSTLLGL